MRILIVSLNFGPELTATGKYTGDMAAWLAHQGHEVHAIAGMPHYPEWRIHDGYRKRVWFTEMYKGVTVYRVPLFVPSINTLNTRTRIAMETSFTLASLPWWFGHLIQKRFDVVIGVCPPLQNAILPWLYNRIRGVPFIFHIQDLQVDAALELGMIHSDRLSAILKRLENGLLSRATYVSTITEAMRQRVIDKGVAPERCLLFPNWSDTSFIRPLPKDKAFRRQLGASEDDFLAIYAGNMGEKQGLEIVIDTAEQLRHLPRIRFALVGNGAKAPELRNKVKQLGLTNVVFHDVLPWKDVPEMLAAADVHLIIQRKEASDLVMPSKLTNIMAAGRPVIVTAPRDSSLAQLVTNKRVGTAIAPEDPDALTQSLKQLSQRPEELVAAGKRARVHAVKTISQDAVLRQFERDLIGISLNPAAAVT